MKSEQQVFIETAAGIWKAIGELSNVGRRFDAGELQYKAYEAGESLQSTLDLEIEDWNSIRDSDHPHIDLCASNTSYVEWNTDKCAVFVANRGNGGYCLECSTRKAAIESREATLEGRAR